MRSCLSIVQRRRVWYEGAGARFRGIVAQVGEVECPGGEVLRYGIELMDWTRPGGPIWSVGSARERA
jgi:hypothetical protein